MNTKTFAQQSRTLLMDGVANKLLYWGFNNDGTTTEEPNPVAGGYTFRGKVFDDETVPNLWKSLQLAIKSKGIDVVKEEAAYTWFNRIMALQIMAKNEYQDDQLAYVPGMANTPQILQKARQGQYSYLESNEQERLKRIITDFSKEQEAFALLLVGYCHSNKMLNNVFGRIDDYTELLLPDNMLQDSGFLHLLNTTDAITNEQYKEVELIGWLYQFYISERKDEVFASFKKKKKAEAKDIPAATQIFTPNWIVKYMVQNTVGKIWLDKSPNSKIKPSMKYLVENESDSISEPIISEVSQLTLIDPAAGSGHILVEGFDLLYQMYMEEYYTPEEAVESILKNNLFGLDIDDRAAQLATFAILLKAAKQYRDVFAKGWLPNVYAMPEYATFGEQEIKDFLGTEGLAYEKELSLALRLMEKAKNLGSVMKLSLSDDARIFTEKRFTELKNADFRDINTEIVYQKIKTFIPVLVILSKKYSSVVANPPYLGYKNLNGQLKQYLESNYPNTSSDLFAVFQELIGELGSDNSRRGIINQWAWMCIESYKKYREEFIKKFHIESLLHLGIGVFKELNTKTVQNVALVFTDKNNENIHSSCFKLDETFDVLEKERLFLNREKEFIKDLNKLKSIPNTPLAFWFNESFVSLYEKESILNDILSPRQGMATGDNTRFVRNWFEVDFSNLGPLCKTKEDAILTKKKWFPYNKGGGYNKWYGNNYFVVNWFNDGEEIKEKTADDLRNNLITANNSKCWNESFYFKEGVSWSLISLNFSARYTTNGYLFDVGGSSGFPNKEDLFYSIALLNSKVSSYILSGLNFTLNVQVGDIKRILFVNPELEEKKKINDLSSSLVSISKKDFDYSELSRDFGTHILIDSLQANLKLSYNKSESLINEHTNLFYNNEIKINSSFLKLYKLENDLDPNPDLNYLTIFRDYISNINITNNELELNLNQEYLISSLMNYFIGVMFGRYRIDKPGLNIAHPNPTKEELASYTYKHGEVTIDQDAILPLMGKNCNFNDDVLKQFNQLLDTIWGQEQRTENINFIQECLDKELEKFLVNDFWKYHCGMYKKTPIYWLFSSKKGAFQVLVYMHRMNEFTVEKIRANYLLEHLKYLKSEIAQKEANSSSLSTTEAKQLDKLRADLIECEQYDLALKNVADQQIKFDLDDGVEKNYELFETVVAKIK